MSNNLIHDIEHAHYGGWGIYTDAASANVVVENNVVYDVSAQAIQPNAVNAPSNREIIVRNNVFAFSGQGLARVPETYEEKARNIPGKAATFERNIFIANGEPIYVAEVGPAWGRPRNEIFLSDLNLFWDISGKTPLLNRSFGRRGRPIETHTWEQWRALASDRHSLIADPKARDIRKRDFTLAADSPAFDLGFVAIDLSDVGPRPPGKRR